MRWSLVIRRLGVVAAVLLLETGAASGAVFMVDGTADTTDAVPGDGACADASGTCTLRAAVDEANALAGADTAVLPAGRYLIGTSYGYGEYGLRVTGVLTLTGAGADATILDGGGNLAGALIASYGVLDLTDLAITGGYTATGAIYSEGPLSLHRVAVRDNVGFAVGGVWIGSSASIVDSIVSGNYAYGICIFSNCAAGVGGVSWESYDGSAIIANSTITGNTAQCMWLCPGLGRCFYGGTAGISARPVEDASLSIIHSTVTDNVVDCSDESYENALGDGPFLFRGSILSNPRNCLYPLASNSSLGGNLDSDGSCDLTDPTDLSNVDPQLGPLQDNGGPTPTHALLRGSPAIDAIPASECTFDDDGNPATPEVPLAADQRGVGRPREGNGAVPRGCDIGAYEVTRCANGLDDDGDGRIDFDGGATAGLQPGEQTAPDPQCTAATSIGEAQAPACGLGAELAVLLFAVRRRRARR